MQASVELKNALASVPDHMYAVQDKTIVTKFQHARSVRRKVLHYLQVIQDGEYLGPLIRANEQLVDALKEYDRKSGISDEQEQTFMVETNQRSMNYDSDNSDSFGNNRNQDNNNPFLQSNNPFLDSNGY